jgi:proteasome lid subunit RPN8/RPN11
MTTVNQALVKGESMATSVRRYREIQLKQKAKLVISQELSAQIMYNHMSNPRIEWSGFLFYTVESGSLQDLDNLKLRAERMYLQDVGSAAYTSFEMTSEKIVDMACSVPDYEESRIGIIHTHHTMGCFFSGTDKDELQENASAHIYYLSLIVNNTGPWCAKIAVPAIRKNNTTILRRDEETGEQREFSETGLTADSEAEDVLYLIDCDIHYELETWYIENYNKIEEERTKYRTVGFQTGQNGNLNSSQNGNLNTGNGQTGSSIPFVYEEVNENSVRVLLTVALKNAIMNERGFDYEDYLKLTYSQRPLLWDVIKQFNLFVNTPKPAPKGKINSIMVELVGNLELIAEDVYKAGMLNFPENLYRIYKEAINMMLIYKNNFSDPDLYNAIVKAFVEQRDLNESFLQEKGSQIIHVS